MPSASALRTQIEHSLERRFPSALTPVPRTIREMTSTGISEVDRLLDGGLPVGAISEVTGPESSGRTSLTLAFLAERTRQGHVCAWVDAHDAFDAESAAANGVDLKRLLWVRCRGTAPTAKSKPWPRLDQALRATDLLLQAGGFAALVLDLGSTEPEHGCRIPLATWFRFRQAADRTRCSLVVLAREPFAQSSAAVVLECAAERVAQDGGTVLNGCSYQLRPGRQRFTPERFTAKIAEVRKPPMSTWQATSQWQREKLQRNKNAGSTKQDVVMEFYGLPPIGQKQRRPMDGAQFHSPRVGEADRSLG
jgi:recombination protein RecA